MRYPSMVRLLWQWIKHRHDHAHALLTRATAFKDFDKGFLPQDLFPL